MREPAHAGGQRGETDLVLVIDAFGAPAPSRRRLRRAKARDADPEAGTTVPMTRFTIIQAQAVEGDPDAWLDKLHGDEANRDAAVARALGCVTRALAARRVSVADVGISDPARDAVLAVRLGYGNGDELVDGRYERAVDLPREAGSKTRTEALRPHERTAAIIGGREVPLACEELLLRARSDMDGTRGREAALQLRVGLEALLAERDAFKAPRQGDDLAFLETRRKITGEAANEALSGALSAERTAEVEETLKICERVLRRQAAHG